MRCADCGTENPDKAKFCIECGHRLVALKCPSCGKTVYKGKFCPECGTRLSTETGSPDAVHYDGLAAAKEEENKKYAERCTKLYMAASYVKSGFYGMARKIYDGLVADDPMDTEAYMGYIRIATKDYTVYKGEEIDRSIRIAQRISGREDLSEFDPDYAAFTERRKKYLEDKKPKPEDELDPFLLFLLGVGYSMGTDEQPVDNEKAAYYYRKAADLGNSQAQCILGTCYEEGCGVERSVAEAVKWYKMAAAQGSNVAKEHLKNLGY